MGQDATAPDPFLTPSDAPEGSDWVAYRLYIDAATPEDSPTSPSVSSNSSCLTPITPSSEYPRGLDIGERFDDS